MDTVRKVIISKDKKKENDTNYTYEMKVLGNAFKPIMALDEVDFT